MIAPPSIVRVSTSTLCPPLLTGARKTSLTLSEVKHIYGVVGPSRLWRRWKEYIKS
ncbi:hypothetical protein KSP39_PZI018517 [Platanthera zijinensis]|uniref:Uncharacterized protein n=1 Tax=Platanthera zijinensis TaxID=2320716 RepID=A0AAP0B468_9ASPA